MAVIRSRGSANQSFGSLTIPLLLSSVIRARKTSGSRGFRPAPRGPPSYRMLDTICHNEKAMGGHPKKHTKEIGRRQSLLALVLDL